MRSLKDRNKGFTVLELILAAALAVLVLGGAYMVYEAGWSTVGRSERKADLQQNTRAALDMLTWQIRLAGYQDLGMAPNRIVIGQNDLLVIRGDVQVLGALVLNDTLFGVQNPDPPTLTCPVPPCLVTGANVYTVAAAPTAIAFGGITAVNFNYFDRLDLPLAAPLDGVVEGAFPDGAAAPNPLPGPANDRDAVRMIQIVLTAVDASVGPRVGVDSGIERITLRANVRFRNAD